MEAKELSSRCFKLIASAFRETGPAKIGKGFTRGLFDMTVFRLKLGSITPVFWIMQTQEALDAIFADELRGRTRPAIVLGTKSSDFDRLKGAFIIFLDPDKLARLSSDAQVRALILQSAQDQLLLTVLSPYETFSAVYGDQFFGRDAEIAKIRSEPDRNFVLYGARRMGKTSLLKQLEHLYNHEIFSVDPNAENYGKAFFISCLGIHSLDGFQEVLLTNLDPSKYWTGELRKLMSKGRHISKDVATLSAFRAVSGRSGRRIILLLDEIDVLLDSPEKNKILDFLRRLPDMRYRVIMAGYKSVWRETQRQSGPLWNLAHPLYIAQFGKEDSLALIQKPMNSLGIELEDGIAARIYKDTGGIPNYMQHYCSVIVSEFISKGKKIAGDIFDSIHSHPDFDTIVMSAFHENVQEPLGKFISYHLASINIQDFTINELIKFARTKGIKHLDYDHLRSSLDYLVTMGFVQTAGESTYRFVAPIILDQLRKRDLKSNLNSVISELKSGIT